MIMLVKAVERPITFKMKDGRILSLRPGVPVALPDSAAWQLLKKAAGKVRAVAPSPSVRIGDRIEWEGSNLRTRSGVVDLIHTGDDGIVWAFCTFPSGGWAAVNTNLAWMDREPADRRTA
jgi:hypothetical protein